MTEETGLPLQKGNTLERKNQDKMERLRIETLKKLQQNQENGILLEQSDAKSGKNAAFLDLPPPYENPPTYQEAKKIKKYYPLYY